MKRRISSTLMALVLCLTLLPAAAYADGARRSMSAAAAMMGPVTALRHAGQGGHRGRGRLNDLCHERPDHDGAARFRPVAIAKKIVVLTKLTLAGKPALCYNFPVASAGFYRSCKYDPYPVESGERLSSKSANIPEPHRIPLNPGPGWDSKEIAWKEGINL